MQSTQSAGSQPPQDDLDFLDGPRKEEIQTKEREFAQLYVELFVNNPTGAQLLAHWEKAIFWRPTPPESSLQRYAADEARRQFIREIRGQIELVLQARSAK